MIVGTTIAAALIAAALTSRLAWGYWLIQPSVSGLVRDVTQLHAFAEQEVGLQQSEKCEQIRRQVLDDLVATVWRISGCDETSSGEKALRRAAATESRTAGENPMGRIPAELLRMNLLPRSSNDVDPDILVGILRLLHEQRRVEKGTPPYANGERLRGYVAVVGTGQGELHAIGSLVGGEISNDMYVYYGVRARIQEGRVQEMLESTSYRFEVAGLEGIRHWMFATIAGTGVLLLWFVFWLIRSFPKEKTDD